MAERSRRVIAYDVACDRRRDAVCKRVSRQAERVQYSVFEGPLSETEARSLLAAVGALLDAATDSVRIYKVAAGPFDDDAVLCAGRPDRAWEADVVV